MRQYALRLKPGTYPPPLVAGMYVAQRELHAQIKFTSNPRAARTWESYQQAYSYLDDNLYGMAEVVEVSLSSPVKIPSWSLIGLAIATAIGGATVTVWEWNNPCNNIKNRVGDSCYSTTPVKPPTSTNPITIGIVSPSANEDYTALATYLGSKLNRLVKIERDTPFEQISDRLARKTWDIAFTRSPIFSIEAESNHYIGVARMFPNEPAYYQAALYVRSDSRIRSLADIKPRNTIALGNPESAPTFYLPIYALYGKSLRVGARYRPIDAVKMVKAGKVDIGAGRYTTVKGDSSLRTIYISRDIPGAGVYLSPLLSIPEQQQIKEALLNAPPEIQAQANYGNGQIPHYDELKKIIFKTEGILNCLDRKTNSFNLKEVVDLFCSDRKRNNVMEGEIRKYKAVTKGNIQFKVAIKGRVYLVTVPKHVLNQIPITPTQALNKSIQLKDVEPSLLADGTRKVRVTRLEQISLSGS